MDRGHRQGATVSPSLVQPCYRTDDAEGRTRRRILLIHNFYASTAPSGEDVVFEEERRLLRSAGHEVIEYVRRNDEFSRPSLVQQVAIGMATMWSSRTYRELRTLIRRSRPEIAHFHNTFPLISASGYAACRSLGVPVVQTLHNYRIACANTLLFRDGMICEECLGHRPWPAVRHRCYRNSAALSAVVAMMIRKDQVLATHRLVDLFIAPTPFVAAKIAAVGVPRDKITIKAHAIEPGPRSNKDGDRRGLVFAGRLVPEKGVMTLLEAARGLPEICLDILGDGPQRAELEAFAHKHDIRCCFRGMVGRQEVLTAMLRARAVVVPSECHEPFGLTVLDAYSCGTPVVAAQSGGLAALVEDGCTGFRFPAGDSSTLRRAIEQVLAQAPDQWAQRVRDHVALNYDPARALSMIESIYRDVIGAARRKLLGHAAG